MRINYFPAPASDTLRGNFEVIRYSFISIQNKMGCAKQNLVRTGKSVFNFSLRLKLPRWFQMNFFQTLRMIENK